MSKKWNLLGKAVKLALTGSWELSGRVEHVDDTKIVLANKEGMTVVYRHHIVAASILSSNIAKFSSPSGSRLNSKTQIRDLTQQTNKVIRPNNLEEKRSHYDLLEHGISIESLPKPLAVRSTEKEENEPGEVQESYYGSIIPEDMLVGEYDEEPRVDFSMTMIPSKSFVEEEIGSSQKTKPDSE